LEPLIKVHKGSLIEEISTQRLPGSESWG